MSKLVKLGTEETILEGVAAYKVQRVPCAQQTQPARGHH